MITIDLNKAYNKASDAEKLQVITDNVNEIFEIIIENDLDAFPTSLDEMWDNSTNSEKEDLILNNTYEVLSILDEDELPKEDIQDVWDDLDAENQLEFINDNKNDIIKLLYNSFIDDLLPKPKEPVKETPTYKIGDRVRIINAESVGNKKVKNGDEATIVDVSIYKTTYGLQFDKKIKGGHDCNHKSKDDYGWYVYPSNFELVPETPKYDLNDIPNIIATVLAKPDLSSLYGIVERLVSKK